nr:glycosyltransferase family 39 protein [Prochlorococcus marinus]
MTLLINRAKYQRCLCLILFLGVLIFCWQLGATGLVDETPPLFAAASRAMSRTGDWLTPRVNGLPRFDKPPLVYWLMGIFYSVPGQNIWDPLGTWSARLPSALSSLVMMLMLGDTLLRWPPKGIVSPRRAAVVAALAFALSPLVLIWSRIAVSDALLCSTLGISLILSWRCYANPENNQWYWSWIFLGLAVLTKGPVAIVLTAMTFICFSIIQRDYLIFFKRVKPIRGIFLSLSISIPWYLMELIKEGKPFWDSFFGYHNFQRLTSVVNSHSQPWWFFLLILVLSSLPFTPFLILGLGEVISSSLKDKNQMLNPPSQSLLNFSASWLISVLLLFTFAATKLPSYWLPATPAAAIVIGISTHNIESKSGRYKLSLAFTSAISFTLALIIFTSSLWIYSINDPEIPNFSQEFIYNRLYLKGSICFAISALICFILLVKNTPNKIFLSQVPLIFFQLLFMLPMWNISDRLRQLPLRQVSTLLVSSQNNDEPIAMVGINKPSLHFYTDRVILFEANDAEGLVNLADRLKLEVRQGWKGSSLSSVNGSRTVLVVIDDQTSKYRHWRGLNPEIIGKYSIYNIWRLDRNKLEQRAISLIDGGQSPDWQLPKPERI